MSKVQTKKINNENEMANFIKLIVIVGVIFALFYLLTAYINREETTTEDTPTQKETIQYDEILVGNMFKQSASNYYLLIEDVEDKNVMTYVAYLNNYATLEGSIKVYKAILNSSLNKQYLADESNITNDITKFKVSKTTLLEISKGKIVKSYEKHEDILELLKKITKGN